MRETSLTDGLLAVLVIAVLALCGILVWAVPTIMGDLHQANHHTNVLHQQTLDTAHAAEQRNIIARYDDCLNVNTQLNDLRAGFRAEVLQAKRTLRLDYKLFPQLKRLRKLENRLLAEELHQYRKQPGHCSGYAARAVPPAQLHLYYVP